MTDSDVIACPPPATTTGDDTGSDLAHGTHGSNRIVIYVCTDWQPPMAGFLVIPDTLTLRAVVAENIQRQQ